MELISFSLVSSFPVFFSFLLYERVCHRADSIFVMRFPSPTYYPACPRRRPYLPLPTTPFPAGLQKLFHGFQNARARRRAGLSTTPQPCPPAGGRPPFGPVVRSSRDGGWCSCMSLFARARGGCWSGGLDRANGVGHRCRVRPVKPAGISCRFASPGRTQ